MHQLFSTRKGLLIACCLLLITCISFSQQPKFVTDSLDKYIEDGMKRWEIPGLAIAIVKDGKVIYTADEPTGGTHFSLVIAGALNISFEEAEAVKKEPGQQEMIYPLVRPVMQKVGTIIARHIRSSPVEKIYLVGGTSGMPGMADVVTEITGTPAFVPPHPLFVTPIGIAMQDPA